MTAMMLKRGWRVVVRPGYLPKEADPDWVSTGAAAWTVARMREYEVIDGDDLRRFTLLDRGRLLRDIDGLIQDLSTDNNLSEDEADDSSSDEEDGSGDDPGAGQCDSASLSAMQPMTRAGLLEELKVGLKAASDEEDSLVYFVDGSQMAEGMAAAGCGIFEAKNGVAIAARV
eukprot:gene11689-biopygen1915